VREGAKARKFLKSSPLGRIRRGYSTRKASLIFSAMASNCSGVKLSLGFEKFISLTEFIGMRWICACGTSRPITATPILIHGITLFMAVATILANNCNSVYRPSSISNKPKD
jgi:hypothetical protein